MDVVLNEERPVSPKTGPSIDQRHFSNTTRHIGSSAPNEGHSQQTLQPDPEQAREFFGRVFRHAPDGGFYSFRAFHHDSDRPPAQIKAEPFENTDAGMDRLVNVAAREMHCAAAWPVGIVLAPPIALFASKDKAGEADLVCAPALAIDCDARPADCVQQIQGLLGTATVIVATGGTWTDPNTGEVQDKVHVVYRLREPAVDVEGFTKVKRCNLLMAKLIGSDPSAAPPSHPMRLAGSLHTKNKNDPRLSRIIGGNPEAEIDLDDALERLEDAYRQHRDAAGGQAKARIAYSGEHQEKAEPTDTLVKQILTGDAYHGPLRALAWRLAQDGMTGGKIVKTLRGFMDAVPPERRDGDEPGRWQSRYNDIPRTVGTAQEKLKKEAADAEAKAAKEPQADEVVPAWWTSMDPTKWSHLLKTTGKGAPRDCLANVAIVLRTDPVFSGKIRHDELLNAPIADGMPWHPANPGALPWTDADDLRIADAMQHHEVFVKPTTVAGGVQLVASENRFHPVRDWLDTLVWDGTKRLSTWLHTYLKVKDSPYAKAVGRKFMIGGVARVREPGCKVDNALILEGDQDLGKSSVANALAVNDRWFTDSISDLGSKDSAQDLCGKWVIELGELSAMRKNDLERTKAFMTRRTDHYRPSYGRRAEDFPRQCVFIGSTNQDAYLHDETGNRRFWPVKVGKMIDLDGLCANVAQLWAEADVEFKAGAKWWLTDEEKPDAAAEQEARRVLDPWAQVIEKWLVQVDKNGTRLRAATAPVLIDDILDSVIHIPIERRDQTVQKRVAGILRGWKWVRLKKRLSKDAKGDRSRPWAWWPPGTSEDDDEGAGEEAPRESTDGPRGPRGSNDTGSSQTAENTAKKADGPRGPCGPRDSETSKADELPSDTRDAERSQKFRENRGATGSTGSTSKKARVTNGLAGPRTTGAPGSTVSTGSSPASGWRIEA
ncbi:MAG TPA: virulence-associated E family protein [Geminicoccus sp.]|jgi:predicted P-loop ATPase|uniref:virulence-associated E family protein n=1 Tax=Geminicoccus sp. TaxID=2024832 RepID=UPI002E35B4B5|nr:virulence-associated E family protein [Geminicoccus sp.]HEX2529812.1 virulence-associated E family protein [Geminicoccus sp.]